MLGTVSESTVFSNALRALTINIGGWIYMYCLIYCLFTSKYLRIRGCLLVTYSFCCRDSLVPPVFISDSVRVFESTCHYVY